jgi:hypothetical protein
MNVLSLPISIGSLIMKCKTLCALFLLVVTALVLSWAASELVRGAVLVTAGAPADDSALAGAGDDHWRTVSRWVFPISFSLIDHDAGRLRPSFTVHFGAALVVSHLMFFAYLFTVGRRGAKRKPLLRLANATLIILFGVPGLIASLIIK